MSGMKKIFWKIISINDVVVNILVNQIQSDAALCYVTSNEEKWSCSVQVIVPKRKGQKLGHYYHSYFASAPVGPNIIRNKGRAFGCWTAKFLSFCKHEITLLHLLCCFFLETLLSFFVVVNFLGTFPIRSIWAYSLQQCCNLSFSSISMLSESSAILSSHELFFLLKKILKHGFCFFFFFGNFPKHGWQNFKHGICSNCEMYLFNFPKHDFCHSEIHLYSCKSS